MLLTSALVSSKFVPTLLALNRSRSAFKFWYSRFATSSSYLPEACFRSSGGLRDLDLCLEASWIFRSSASRSTLSLLGGGGTGATISDCVPYRMLILAFSCISFFCFRSRSYSSLTRDFAVVAATSPGLFTGATAGSPSSSCSNEII